MGGLLKYIVARYGVLYIYRYLLSVREQFHGVEQIRVYKFILSPNEL